MLSALQSWWVWLLGTLAVVAFGWAVQRILDKGWDGFWRKRREEDLAKGEPIDLPDSPQGKFTSHFARTPSDLETVLRLRRTFFGSKVVVSDEAYRLCWQRNLDAMKVVYCQNEPVGYWSVIPITATAFQEFVLGRITHHQMLTRHCLDWAHVDPDAAYLYIVGAVVPSRTASQEATQSLLLGILRGQVILDLYCFAQDVLENATVRGICGYPSRTGGYRLFERKAVGFEKLKTLIDQDEMQPIFAITESRMAELRGHLTSHLKKSRRKAARWEPNDRRRFLSMLSRLRAAHAGAPKPQEQRPA